MDSFTGVVHEIRCKLYIKNYCMCCKHLSSVHFVCIESSLNSMSVADYIWSYCWSAYLHRQPFNLIISVQVLSVVGLLQDETDPMVSVMKVGPAVSAAKVTVTAMSNCQ